jgi:hypothetical protein
LLRQRNRSEIHKQKEFALNMKIIAKILVIEDDTPVAMMIANLLTRAKCEVVVEQTAEKGMQMAERGG